MKFALCQGILLEAGTAISSGGQLPWARFTSKSLTEATIRNSIQVPPGRPRSAVSTRRNEIVFTRVGRPRRLDGVPDSSRA